MSPPRLCTTHDPVRDHIACDRSEGPRTLRLRLEILEHARRLDREGTSRSPACVDDAVLAAWASPAELELARASWHWRQGLLLSTLASPWHVVSECRVGPRASSSSLDVVEVLLPVLLASPAADRDLLAGLTLHRATGYRWWEEILSHPRADVEVAFELLHWLESTSALVARRQREIRSWLGVNRPGWAERIEIARGLELDCISDQRRRMREALALADAALA